MLHSHVQTQMNGATLHCPLVHQWEVHWNNNMITFHTGTRASLYAYCQRLGALYGATEWLPVEPVAFYRVFAADGYEQPR